MNKSASALNLALSTMGEFKSSAVLPLLSDQTTVEPSPPHAQPEFAPPLNKYKEK